MIGERREKREEEEYEKEEEDDTLNPKKPVSVPDHDDM